jgi:MFS family permease
MPNNPMKPSFVRYQVVMFAIVLVVITYIDRVCISNFRPFIAKDLGLNNAEMGVVFSAFALSYALFEIPTGWLGDIYGTRTTITRIVVWWSVFTAATGFVFNRTSLIITRFLFGIGEAGAFPTSPRSSPSGCRQTNGSAPRASYGWPPAGVAPLRAASSSW